MKRIKSFTALICILTILLSISACDLKSQITTPEETTTIPTTATITETTVATTTTETTETETVATTTTETSEETSETTAATKATTKPTKPSSKKKTTKPTSKKVTSSAKKVVKKSPTKAPAKKPSKGYAIVKVRFHITLNDHDSNGNNIKIDEYCECEAYTTTYHSKRSSDYHLTDKGKATKKAFLKKYNIRNYSTYIVKVVKFTN
jgi:outer membrane biosynthesis protein TonB